MLLVCFPYSFIMCPVIVMPLKDVSFLLYLAFLLHVSMSFIWVGVQKDEWVGAVLQMDAWGSVVMYCR